MKGKAFTPTRLGRNARPAWLQRFGSGRAVLISLALTLLAFGLTSVVVFRRQPYILQGDGRWDDVRDLLWPIELTAGLAAGLSLLLLLNAAWPLLTATARWVGHGLSAALSVVIRGVDAGLLRPTRWAVGRLGAALRWLSAVLIQPAGRLCFSFIRLIGGVLDRLLVKGAGRAIGRGITASARLVARGAHGLAQFALSTLAEPTRRAGAGLGGALRWMGTHLKQDLFQPVARLAQLAAAGLGRLAAGTGWVLGQAARLVGLAVSQLVAVVSRLTAGTGWVLGQAARPVVWLVRLAVAGLSRLAAGIGWLLRQALRLLGLAVRPIGSAVGAGLSGGLALFGWAGRVGRRWTGQAAGGLRAAAAGARAWHASLSEGQALVVLGATTLFSISAGLQITTDLLPNWFSDGALAFATVVTFAPSVALGLVLGRKLQLAVGPAWERKRLLVALAGGTGKRAHGWKFAVAGGALAILAGCLDTAPAAPCARRNSNVVEVCIYSANTKEDWLNAVRDAFNAAEVRTAGGKPIVVHAYHVTSGASQEDILDGTIRPTVWSPGDQSWADGANLVWQERHGQPLIPEACQPTVYAPVGFAMWREFAEAMGWPDEPISWDTLVTLAADPEGWGRYGHPEWGAFKFGHTHPDYSNSGLLMLTALAYSTFDLTDGLTPELVESQPFVDALRAVELNTYHYGRQSRDLLALMAQRGPDYLHAINTTEAETLKTNQEQAAALRFPLVFIFPAEGTFWTEQPYCVLDAEWVSAEQREAAGMFEAYLHEPAQQALAVDYYVRPVDPSIPLGEHFTLANGTDPRVTRETVSPLASPSGEVADAVKRVFHATKKGATVLLVLDTSGSMAGDKIENARAATANFIGRLAGADEVAVMVFNNTVIELEPAGTAGEVAEPLSQAVLQQNAGGGTALYDAVCAAVERMEQQQAEDAAAGERRLYGIVVLSDGVNQGGTRGRDAMFQCLPSGEEVEGIKVFTIGYGGDADQELLAEIAQRTNGKDFTGDPATIEQIYLAISAEQ